MSAVLTNPITGETSITGSLTVDNINIRGITLGSVASLSSNATWLPSTSLQWTPVVAPNLPTFSIPNGGTMTYSRRNGVYRWIGNDLSYNINVAGLLNTASTVTTGDYTLNVPYPINVGAYSANTLIGELWLTTYYLNTSNTFKAYARTMGTNASNVTIRVLAGTADDTLTTALANTTMILQGTMTYNTSSFNQVGGVPAAYLPATFYQNAEGQVLLNSNLIGGVVAPRGQLDIVYNSNLPAVVIDQLGTGDALQIKESGAMRMTMDVTGNLFLAGSSPFTSMVWTRAASFSWTVPANVYRCEVLLIGGGGAGAGRATNLGNGGGGGGAGGICSAIIKLVPGDTVTVVVGAGGTAGTGNGGTGASSVFTISGKGSMTAIGGSGGQVAVSGSPGILGIGGFGGAAGSNTLQASVLVEFATFQGGDGDSSTPAISGASFSSGGTGGASLFGTGGAGATRFSTSVDATDGPRVGRAPGSGGGGAGGATAGSSVTQVAANGAAGICIVHY
jgi:hypothetical protein